MQERVTDETETADNSMVRQIAARLRQAVDAKGGQSAISRLSGVPLSTLNGYLSGVDMKATNMVALAKACEVSVEWLATGNDPASSQSILPAPTEIAMFASINIDQLARAMLTARDQFAARGGNPTWREQAQVVSIIYDMITAQETGKIPGRS